jgi:putative membrane protein
MFDAQKDMALAGLGALLAMPLVRRAGWWKGPQQ